MRYDDNFTALTMLDLVERQWLPMVEDYACTAVKAGTARHAAASEALYRLPAHVNSTE